MYYQHLISEWDLYSPVEHGFINEDFYDLKLNPTWQEQNEIRQRNFAGLPQFSPTITEPIKQKARFGIPHDQRRKWWFIATRGIDLLSKFGNVWPGALQLSQKTPQTNMNEFGGFNLMQHLPPSQQQCFQEFLHVIWVQNPKIDFAPLIPTVSYLLLLYQEPPLAYLSIQSMIRRSTEDSWYFTLTRESFLACVRAFRELAHNKCSSVVSHADSLKLDIAQIALALFPVFFMPFMPLHVALTVFDSFCVEGRKVLVRFALNLILQQKAQLLRSKSAREFITILISGLEHLSDSAFLNSFIEGSFNIYLSRERHIQKYEKSALSDHSSLQITPSYVQLISPDVSSILTPTDFKVAFTNSAPSMTRSVSLNGFDRQTAFEVLKQATPEEVEARQQRLNKQLIEKALPKAYGGKLLTPSLFCSLRDMMPPFVCQFSAYRVFSISNQGTTFISMFQATQKRGQYIMIIQTPDSLLGAFLSDSPRPHPHYFGKPYCFVFDAKVGKIYKAGSKPPNQFFMSVSNKTFIIGGPRAAIYFEDGFKEVISERCDTFDSPPLINGSEKIINLELYLMTEFDDVTSSDVGD